MYIIFSCFLLTSFLIILTYLLGSIITKIRIGNFKGNTTNDYLSVSIKILVGLISIILFFSVFITKGVTINILFLLVGLLFLIGAKVEKADEQVKSTLQKSEIPVILNTIVVLAFFTTLCFILFNNFQSKLVATNTSPDHYYYSYFATKMVEFGIEGTNFTLNTSLLNAKQFRLPYHYFDFWMIALFQKLIFNKAGLAQIYSFCFTPFVLTLCWQSLTAVFNLFKNKLSFTDLLIVLFLTMYIAPAEFNFFTGLNLMNASKIYCSVVVMSVSFCYFFQKQIIQGFIFLALLPIMNILALPVVCIAAGCYAMIYLYKKEYKQGAFLSISFFLIGISILFFYTYWGTFGNKVLVNDFNLKQLIFGGLVYAVKILGRLLVAISPLLILSFFLREFFRDFYKQHKTVIIISALIIFTGYLMSVALWNILDSGQIRSYPANALVGILIISVIAVLSQQYSLFSSNKKLKIAYISTFIFSTTCFISISIKTKQVLKETLVSKAFIKEISENIQSNNTYGYIYNKERNNTSIWANNPNLVVDNLNFLSLLPVDLNKVSLSVFLNQDSIPKNFKGFTPIINDGDLKRFADSLNYTTLNQAQVAFIQKKQIKYLVTSSIDNLPDTIKPYVSKTIQDAYSKKCFFVLK